MLWDIIRDFIVQHITGGITSNGVGYSGQIGQLSVYSNGEIDDAFYASVQDIRFLVNTENGNTSYLGLGDWLATTLTIIAMCLLFAFAVWLIRWVFKAVSSAFLLRR